MKYIASVSFGKDSLAMLLKLIESGRKIDEVVFYDTGMEFDCIYKIRDQIKNILSINQIKFTEIKSENSFLYDMLVRPVKYRNPQKQRISYTLWLRMVRW